jgi:hypothetical protein
MILVTASALSLPLAAPPGHAGPIPKVQVRAGVTTNMVPTPGPVDRFKNRRPIGQEALVTVGNQGQPVSSQEVPKVNVRRVSVDSQNPPQYVGQRVEFERAKSQKAGFRSAAVEADLDLIERSGEFVESRQPGLAHAGFGYGCPTADVLCVSWSRPFYTVDEHQFDGFGSTYGVELPGAPKTNSQVSLVSAKLGDQRSLVVSYVDSVTGTLKVAHIVPERGASGWVSGLVIAGPVLDLGEVLNETDPTSASLAAGDFTGSGQDQVGVAWAPASSVAANRAYRAALLTVDDQGALIQTVNPQTVQLTMPNINDAGEFQTSPGLAAVLDTRSDTPVSRLLVGAGVYGYGALQRLTVAKTGEFHVDIYKVGDQYGNPYDPASWDFYHSRIAPIGDVNGDGVAELVSKVDADFYGGGGSEAHMQTLTLRGFVDSVYHALDEVGVPDGSQLTVLDARTTKNQALTPVPGKASAEYLPQIAVVSTDRCLFSGSREALRVYSLDTDGYTRGGFLDDLSECGDAEVPSIASFALDGRAELGDPIQGQYRTIEPMVILNAPPTHFDVLDGRMYDPNFCYAGNQYAVPEVCFFTSEYERETTASLEVSSEAKEDWSVSATVSVGFSIGLAEIEAEVKGGYGQHFEKTNATTTTDTVEVTVKARNTDKIYAIRRAYDTLEYPLFQPGATSASGYIMTTTPTTISKRWIDINSPDAVGIDVNHQPGNILSYPENISTAENPFIAPETNASGQVIEAFAPQEFELSDFSDFSYALTQDKVTTAGASTERHWNIGSTIKGGGKVAGLVDVSVELSGDYSNSQLSTTKTSIGSKTKLSATLGGIDESFGETAYTVKPFAYWTDSATLVLDYAVSPGTAPPGEPKTWWQQMYGRNPDLTMKLPRLLDYEKQAGISSDAARFISPGVRIFKGPCNPADLRMAAADYFKPGAALCLRAMVENYSLKENTAGTTVKFFDADPDVGGVLLGQTTVPAVAARGSQAAYLNWTPDARYAGSVPRIFAVVDADNGVTEIHENNNKGFRSYRAVPSVTVGARAAQDVEALVSSGRTMLVTWVDGQYGVQPSGYQWHVFAYPEDGGPALEAVVAGNESSATLTDVPPGRYRVTVFSFTDTETSPASHPSEPVDVASESPGSPSQVAGIAGDSAVVLQWKAPTATGGVPVDSYRIREFRQAGEDYPETAIDTTVNGNTTGMTLSGLSNGRPYRFTVQAINAAGPGEQSYPSAAVTPLGVPDRATNVRAERSGPGTAKVAWEAPPLSSKRSPVTAYQIEVTPGGGITEVAGKAIWAEIPDLQRGVPYTFTVRPLSATGRALQSEPSNPLTLPDAPTAPRNVTAKPGAEAGSAVVSWIQPNSTGGVPLDSYEICWMGGECREEPAASLKATFFGLPVGAPLVFTVKARNEAGLESPTESTSGLTLAVAPRVEITSGPAEGSFTKPETTIEFSTSIEGAELTCFVDGIGQPCSSPLRLTDLVDGRHTFVAKAVSEGGTASSALRTWTVDGLAPKATVDDLPLIARKGIPKLKYSGVDHGGSGLAGYQIRTRENGLLGTFSTPVVVTDPSTTGSRSRRLAVARGTTVCASVRASDSVGNVSEWSDYKCAARPLDELGLTASGWWQPVKSRFFSEGHALMTYAGGSALSVRIGRAEAVSVTAVSCSDCGRLEVRSRGQLLKVINLSAHSVGDSGSASGRHAKEFTVPWPESARGYLRLVALGGGPVIVDGVTVQRQK